MPSLSYNDVLPHPNSTRIINKVQANEGVSRMTKKISVHAISVNADIPTEFKRFFDERIEIRNIFGTKCYVILEDEENSPLNFLDEEYYRKLRRWLSTVASEKIFSYSLKVG